MVNPCKKNPFEITTAKRVLVGILLISLFGCGNLQHADYERPKIETPQHWFGQIPDGVNITLNQTWWQAFGDARLNHLIEEVLRINNNLAVATLKVRQAQAQAGLVSTNVTPDVSLQISGNMSKNLNSGAVSERTYSTSLSMSYELDLWGRLSSLRNASEWEAVATDFDRRATALSLIASTAQLYWLIALDNELIQRTEVSIDYAKRTLNLVQTQYSAGAVSGLDVAQAERAYETQQAVLNEYLRLRDERRNAFAILFDRAPESRNEEPVTLPDGPIPSVPNDLPSTLIDRRPDLQAAEWRLRKVLANYDAARTSFYPRFSLTGAINTSGGTAVTASSQLTNILSNPIGAINGTLILPFLEWNKRRFTVESAQLEHDQAVIAFRQSVFGALSEVENALSGRLHYQREGEQRARALSAA